MTMNRRALLRGLFAAPAIVAAANIMPVKALLDLKPRLWGDGIHDDGPAIRAMIAEIERKGGGQVYLPPGKFWIARDSIRVPENVGLIGSGIGTIIERTSGNEPVIYLASGSGPHGDFCVNRSASDCALDSAPYAGSVAIR